ncbi:hypothetical protein BJX63DRAFT_437372 [Aspergillus granulosus]|uniref:Uncharacterized protein n=1 Tax=Aspergillus granulosus TaxID=176169 RepID=A0ABR4GVB5_9EURO
MAWFQSDLLARDSLTTPACPAHPEPKSGYRLIYLPPAKRSPLKADLNQMFAIVWRLVDKKGSMCNLDSAVVTPNGQKLRRKTEPLIQSIPLVLFEEFTLAAMRKNPTMGGIWVYNGQISIHNGEETVTHREIAFSLQYAVPDGANYMKPFYTEIDWDKATACAKRLRYLAMLFVEFYGGLIGKRDVFSTEWKAKLEEASKVYAGAAVGNFIDPKLYLSKYPGDPANAVASLLQCSG